MSIDAAALEFEAELRVAPETGSWTVFDVPGSRAFFGTGNPVRATGTIDDHAITVTLMPTGNGAHVGPVKADLRRVLRKAAGDSVRVRLQRARP